MIFRVFRFALFCGLTFMDLYVLSRVPNQNLMAVIGCFACASVVGYEVRSMSRVKADSEYDSLKAIADLTESTKQQPRNPHKRRS